MKAIVTGGCGFIGGAVVAELLDQGWEVLIVDSLYHGPASIFPRGDSARLVRTDVRELTPDHLQGFSGASWIHLAAMPFIPDSFADPLSVFDVNVIGTTNACQVALAMAAERFVCISTCEVYRSDDIGEILDESAPLDPLSPYANSKLCAELVTERQCSGALPYLILRLFNSYGPRYTQPYFIPEMIRQCLGETAVRVGALDTCRDFTYVADTARAIVLAATVPGLDGQRVNIGSGVRRTMGEVLARIQELTSSSDKSVVKDNSRHRPPGRNPKCFVACAERAERLLGWRPEIGFDEGLRLTIEGVRKRLCSDVNEAGQ